MTLRFSLALSAIAMTVCAASAQAGNVVVDQTVDLTKASGLGFGYINGNDQPGVFTAPFQVDVAVGDTVTLNFTFAGTEQVTTQNLSAANVSIWTKDYAQDGSISSSGTLSFLDMNGNIVYSVSKTDQDCCVHVGQFFFGGMDDAPTTMTFHSMTWSGTVTGYDGYTTRTYNDPNLLIAAGSVSLSGSAAVPEPASWAMMLGGFGLVGGAMRSRRKAAVSFA